jgi:phospholipase C
MQHDATADSDESVSNIQAQQALDDLSKIDHIVVLMLENRSFDHMLGYLRLEGGRNDVDGLLASMSNRFQGTTYAVHHLGDTVFEEDPGHDSESVQQQLGNGNGGFVQNFARLYQNTNPGKIMGYYNATNLPAYDRLTGEFTICQRWFCSFPGPTWPNRLYATVGHSNGETANRDLPVYSLATFFRHLDARDVMWKWYSHDISTLRLIDDRYRLGHSDHFDSMSQFYQDAQEGRLASVSWIDPNYADIGNVSNANDDHPPADVVNGQELVLDVCNALINSPRWHQILFVLTYDEHGGFYDHVAPPAAVDDRPGIFRNYGPRVPAIIVCPWVPQRSVSSIVFDHTCIIKTILLRFCRASDGNIPNMGARVAAANHLGALLTEATPRPRPPVASSAFIQAMAPLRVQVLAAKHKPSVRVESRREPTDLQQQITAAKAFLTARGHPQGMP